MRGRWTSRHGVYTAQELREPEGETWIMNHDTNLVPLGDCAFGYHSISALTIGAMSPFA